MGKRLYSASEVLPPGMTAKLEQDGMVAVRNEHGRLIFSFEETKLTLDDWKLVFAHIRDLIVRDVWMRSLERLAAEEKPS